MTDIASTDFVPVPSPLEARFDALRHALHMYRRSREADRRKREIYRRTLRELRSYRNNELHDLKIDPADFEAVARMQAGW